MAYFFTWYEFHIIFHLFLINIQLALCEKVLSEMYFLIQLNRCQGKKKEKKTQQASFTSPLPLPAVSIAILFSSHSLYLVMLFSLLTL